VLFTSVSPLDQLINDPLPAAVEHRNLWTFVCASSPTTRHHIFLRASDHEFGAECPRQLCLKRILGDTGNSTVGSTALSAATFIKPSGRRQSRRRGLSFGRVFSTQHVHAKASISELHHRQCLGTRGCSRCRRDINIRHPPPVSPQAPIKIPGLRQLHQIFTNPKIAVRHCTQSFLEACVLFRSRKVNRHPLPDRESFSRLPTACNSSNSSARNLGTGKDFRCRHKLPLQKSSSRYRRCRHSCFDDHPDSHRKIRTVSRSINEQTRAKNPRGLAGTCWL